MYSTTEASRVNKVLHITAKLNHIYGWIHLLVLALKMYLELSVG